MRGSFGEILVSRWGYSLAAVWGQETLGLASMPIRQGMFVVKVWLSVGLTRVGLLIALLVLFRVLIIVLQCTFGRRLVSMLHRRSSCTGRPLSF